MICALVMARHLSRLSQDVLLSQLHHLQVAERRAGLQLACGKISSCVGIGNHFCHSATLRILSERIATNIIVGFILNVSPFLL